MSLLGYHPSGDGTWVLLGIHPFLQQYISGAPSLSHLFNHFFFFLKKKKPLWEEVCLSIQIKHCPILYYFTLQYSESGQCCDDRWLVYVKKFQQCFEMKKKKAKIFCKDMKRKRNEKGILQPSYSKQQLLLLYSKFKINPSWFSTSFYTPGYCANSLPCLRRPSMILPLLKWLSC